MPKGRFSSRRRLSGSAPPETNTPACRGFLPCFIFRNQKNMKCKNGSSSNHPTLISSRQNQKVGQESQARLPAPFCPCESQGHPVSWPRVDGSRPGARAFQKFLCTGQKSRKSRDFYHHDNNKNDNGHQDSYPSSAQRLCDLGQST